MTTMESNRAAETKRKNPSKHSILVIDDSEDTLLLQRTVLEMEGFEVFTATSGAAALSLINQIQEPSLILLDMQIGDMTGTEFLINLEQTHPQIIEDVPVVLVTGMNEVPPSKAVGFIHKPADLEKFIQAVHSYIEQKTPSLKH